MKKYLILINLLAIVYPAFLRGQNAARRATTYISSLKTPGDKGFAYAKGNYSIGDNGAFNYELPVLCVPGTAGMMPKLSIVYNSNSGTGILGEGWNLTGLSIITRGSKTLAQDNENGTITFSGDDDRLFMDGQRLVKVTDQETNYWATSQNPIVHYRTELNTFKDIVAVYDGNLGIKSFTVSTKDGLIYQYGYLRTGNGIDREGYLRTSHDELMSWLLLRIKDRNGNFIQFDYNGADLKRQFIRPEMIEYTGHINSETESRPYAYVRFNYDNGNNNALIRDNPFYKYISGQKIIFDKYLSSVECFYDGADAVPAKNHVRTYKMYYLPGLNDTRKLYLDHVDECVNPGDVWPNALRTSFKWHTEEATSKLLSHTIHSSGSTLTENYQIFFGDFDGNGLTDKCAFNNKDGKLNFVINMNKKGSFSADILKTVDLNIPLKNKVLAADIDGNGTTDFVFNWIDNNKWFIQPVLVFTDKDGNVDIRPDPARTMDIQNGVALTDINLLNTDLSGDGLTDLMMYYYKDRKVNLQYALNAIHNRFVVQKFQAINTITAASDTIPDKTPLTYGDFNGDGRNDFLFTWTNSQGWHTSMMLTDANGVFNAQANPLASAAITVNNGNIQRMNTLAIATKQATVNIDSVTQVKIDTIVSASSSSSQVFVQDVFKKYKNIYPIDVNHDGNQDLVIVNVDSKGWDIWTAINKGDGTFESPKPSKVDATNYDYGYAISFGEFNGDGITDMVIMHSNGQGCFVKIAYGDGTGLFNNKNQGELRIADLNFSYQNKFPVSGMICAQHFLEASLDKRPDDILKINNNQPIDAAILGDKPKFIEYLINKIYKNSFVPTPYFPATAPGFFDGYTNQDCDQNGFKKITADDENIKRLGQGVNYEADGFTDVSRYVFPLQQPYPKENVNFAKSIAFNIIDYWRPVVLDINGDGISDFVISYPRQPEPNFGPADNNPLDGSWKTIVIENAAQRSNLIDEVDLGNGYQIKVEYSGSIKEAPFDPGLNVNYPSAPYLNPINIVKSIQTSNGVGGFNKTSYVFKNGIISMNGRGFISFQKVITTNENNGNRSVKEFLIDDAFLKWGMMPVWHQQTALKSGTVISEDTYNNALFPYTDGNYTYNYIKNKMGIKRELDGTVISQLSTDYVYDSFGNLTISDTHYPNGIKERLTNEYFENDAPDGANTWRDRWLIGRLKKSVFRKEANGRDAPVEKISGYSYDVLTGQLTSETNLLGTRYELIKNYSYDDRGNKRAVKMFPGQNAIDTPTDTIATLYNYDVLYSRFLTSTKDAEGYTSSATADPVFSVDTATVDKNGKMTIFSVAPANFDPFGSKKTIIYPDGNRVVERNYLCQDCKVPNAVYFNTRKSTVEDYPVITFFDLLDRPIGSVSFDPKGRMIRKIDTYDKDGFIIASTLPYFDGSQPLTEQMSHDVLGRLKEVHHADGTLNQVKYGPLTETFIDPKGRTKIKQKDMFGRIISETDPAGNTVSYEYDLFGNPVTITDQKHRKFITQYNLQNQKEKYYNPNVGQWETYDYNALGERIRVRTGDDGSVVITYTYDKLGRLTGQKEAVPASNGRTQIKNAVTWNYIGAIEALNGKGMLKSVVNSSASQDRKIDRYYVYDPLGRLVSKTFINNFRGNADRNLNFDFGFDHQFQFKYDYDLKGRLSKITYPKVSLNDYNREFSVTYNYTGSTVISVVSNSNVKIWELKDTYADGKTRDIALSDGSILTSYNYNEKNNQLNEILTRQNNRVVQDWSYTFDVLGNVTSRADNGFNKNLVETFSYDQLNRITSTAINTDSVLYQYDVLGQLTYKSDVGYYKYNEGLKKLQINKDKAKNDIEDERLKKDDVEYYYDDLGNRTKKELNEEVQFEIAYNNFNKPDNITHFGERWRDNFKDFYYGTDNSLEVQLDLVDKHYSCKYFIDGLFEMDYQINKPAIGTMKAGQVNQRFLISVNGNLVAFNDVSSVNNKKEHLIYYQKDITGSVTAVTDNKKVLQRFSYDIWGARRDLKTWHKLVNLSDSTFSTDKSFAGHQSWDDLELVNMDGRIYDPVVAQFLTPDPLINLSIPTQGLTGYSYCYNNPLIFTDPTGYGFLGIDWGGVGRFVVRTLIAAPLIPVLGPAAFIVPNLPGVSGWIDKNAGTIVAIELTIVFTVTGVTAVCPPAAGFGTGFGSSFAQSYLNGGSFGQSLEAGLVGGTTSAVTAGFTYAIGSAFTGSGALFGDNELLNGAGKAVAHGTFQGVMNEAQGGDFRSGFIGGSVSSLGDPLYQNIGGNTADAVIERTAIAASLGGTASALGGGKFMNGAASAAMVNLYNSELHNFSQAGKIGNPGNRPYTDADFMSCTDNNYEIQGIQKNLWEKPDLICDLWNGEKDGSLEMESKMNMKWEGKMDKADNFIKLVMPILCNPPYQIIPLPSLPQDPAPMRMP